MVPLGVEGSWTSTLAILDTEAGPNPVKQCLAVTARLSSIKRLKAPRLRLTGTKFFKVMGFVTAELQIGQLQQKVQFLVVPILAINVILETSFNRKYIDGFSPKNVIITSRDSSPVVIAGKTQLGYIIGRIIGRCDGVVQESSR